MLDKVKGSAWEMQTEQVQQKSPICVSLQKEVSNIFSHPEKNSEVLVRKCKKEMHGIGLF